jgi:hypothetical protein
MASLSHCTRFALLAAVSLLSACATTVSVSDLSEPNFGYRVMPHFDASVDPDPMAIANGLYAPHNLQYSCFRCSTPLEWSGWSP